ncbi:MAG TPA: saccharopine dehydrogenase C-terminal domain-containing protein [Rhodocyclaceae bacterium]
MHEYPRHAAFTGRVLIVGFGSIGQGFLPLLLRHVDMPAERVAVITADADGADIAARYGVSFTQCAITPENYRETLAPRIGAGDFLLNLAVNVSSLALMEFCQARGAHYLDTCIEPWAGGYIDCGQSMSARSNYALREDALEIGRRFPGGPTAVLTHGMNPGVVSHFAKQALLNLATDAGISIELPATREQWAALARRLSIKAIHIAERDTQIGPRRRSRGEFVNTWSADAFLGESLQPAELGWGTHERLLPADAARHAHGSDAAIYLKRPGLLTRVRSWTPLEGPYHGFLVTHAESISLADYLTVRDGARVLYRPTVHYAYHPCDDALLSLHESAGHGYAPPDCSRLLMDDITDGMDELGVLLMGHARGAYWYGSRLTIGEARALSPHNNATSLQVTAGVLAGMVWAIRNPAQGIIEPEAMDHRETMEILLPYMGEMAAVYSDWTPLHGRDELFPESLYTDDPWQFSNIRVS